jgi:PRTRC genetic system protein A
MHKLDAALASSFPMMTIPKYGVFNRLDKNGQRLLVAENGFFIEVRRDWLYAIQPCGHHAPLMRFPFGSIKPVIELDFGAVPKRLIDEFIAMARLVAPDELAGVMIYDRISGLLDLRICKSQEVSSTRVKYEMPLLQYGESVAVDIHSHGDTGAGFSLTDNQDDQAATKIAVVVGTVRSSTMDVAARLCLQGVFIPLMYQDKVISRNEGINREIAMIDRITEDRDGRNKYF